MRLLAPNIKYSRSWNQAVKEYEAQKTFGSWYSPKNYRNMADFIKQLKEQSKGENLSPGWVRATSFWLIDKGQYIGSVNIRHKLNPYLKTIGGHIGYAIRPSRWNQGYGNQILRLALKKAKLFKLKKVLVTCNDDNLASGKIIEKNGGQLKEKALVEAKLIRRYWIKL